MSVWRVQHSFNTVDEQERRKPLDDHGNKSQSAANIKERMKKKIAGDLILEVHI